MNEPTLLIDGDMLIFRSCVAVEKDVVFDDRYHILFSDFEQAWGVLYDTLLDLQSFADTEHVIFCLSDPKNIWRKDVDPTYKAHRKESRKPLAYWDVVDEVTKKFDVIEMPNLEADDALGILQTSHDNTIIWSLDKDMKQIPGMHLVADEVVEITPEEAKRFHMFQTLVGDTADGYPGCPGIGAATADRILRDMVKAVPTQHILKSGKNKGQEVVRWEEVPTDDLWEVVVSHYEKAGLTEDDALLQARLSRILHANEFQNNEVILWTPN